MNKTFESLLLKILLCVFGVGGIYLALDVFPNALSLLMEVYPVLMKFENYIYFIGQLLILFLIAGLIIIVKLLTVYEKANTFSFSFLSGLEYLIGLCGLAFLGLLTIVILLVFNISLNSLLVIFIFGVLIFILILATVIKLIHSIVKSAIEYKTDYDLTV